MHLLAFFLAAVTLLVAACSGSESASTPESAQPQAVASVQPTDTPTPQPTATSQPEPTSTPEPEPTQAPPPPPPTQRPAPPVSQPPVIQPPPAPPPSDPSNVTIRAVALAYSPSSAVVAAGTPVTITLQNSDAAVSHDLTLPGIGKTNLCAGPCSSSLTVSLAPGSYRFTCSTHPEMAGQLTAR